MGDPCAEDGAENVGRIVINPSCYLQEKEGQKPSFCLKIVFSQFKVAPHLTVESQKNRQGAESAKFFKIYDQ
ncbi:MAG: hypothetical protein B6I38_10015 [Anaerolineaceae bacterium 4572_5.1]|nr:MAG: hypothetical protein B6I38_10015 [Anaerolineaceae bacterium 4572_5.1]